MLELVVEGLTNAEIATQLYLSENTVKKYLRNILQKFHLNSRVEAAVYAVRAGIVEEHWARRYQNNEEAGCRRPASRF